MGTKNQLQIAIAVELARRGLKQTDLARLACIPPSSLSAWLRGVWPPPPHFNAKLEAALGLEPGSLPAAGTSRAAG